MKPRMLETKSFFIPVSCHIDCFQEELNPFVSKLRRFTASNYALLRNKEGHCWRINLYPQRQRGKLVSTGEEEQILVLTHIEMRSFEFRLFGANGFEKLGPMNSPPNCACHTAGKLPSVAQIIKQRNREVGQVHAQTFPTTTVTDLTLHLRPLPSFSVVLKQMSVRVNFIVDLPARIYRTVPFVRDMGEIKIVWRDDEETEEWNVGFRNARLGKPNRRLQKGWGMVVQELGLQEGDICRFILLDQANWTYQMNVTRSPRTRK